MPLMPHMMISLPRVVRGALVHATATRVNRVLRDPGWASAKPPWLAETIVFKPSVAGNASGFGRLGVLSSARTGMQQDLWGLAVSRVWLWHWRLDQALLDDSVTLLSREERNRADKFVHPHDRRRFVTAHGGLRTILGHHIGADPASLVFENVDHAKPRLAHHSQVSFNLAHSHERALLALSEGPELGVDLEHRRPLEHADIAQRYFHPNEAHEVTHAHGETAAHIFFKIWAMKEAVIKATGEGLATPLDSFEVSPLPPHLKTAPPGAPGLARWQVLSFDLDDYCAALAVIDANAPVELIQRTL
jgi:4'-phosphopantetheinyl transferase